ncbi:GNAT family N-acetyltransferase [Treponema pedis]|uniref:GNAT family N-acetyltransferase n=1 Tax=Treponema pedis TaxID=409322 RepID=A0A7S7AWM7_9SPIR|nr:GNAT family N-acetyltransferase [Treponema pedis]QOW60889.1 GNAT family N-acetyltransferase [Treponema pedis]
MKLFVSSVSEKNIDSVIYSILPKEQTCINLAEGLKKQKRFFEEEQKYSAFTETVVFSDENKIIGVLALSPARVLLHCFIKEIPDCIYGYIAISFLKDSPPSSIMGEKKASSVLEKIVEKYFYKKPSVSEDYKLLILQGLRGNDFLKTAEIRAGGSLSFVKPSISDIKQLCPLEADYQETEVLHSGEKASFDLCFNLLAKRIDNNALYAVKKENRFIAKAAINASGFFWNQIGGVYTLPEFRNKGIGSAAVFFLIKDCFSDKKSCALFVKIKNSPARKMYNKIGFTEYCDFRISYY